MIKHGLEGVDLYNPIKGKLPQLIEYFVEFYGEEYRERITENLKNTVFLFTDRVTENEFTPIEEYFYFKKRELLEKFQDEVFNTLKIKLNFSTDNLEESMIRLAKFKDGINNKNLLLTYEFFLHVKTKKYQLTNLEKLEDCINDEKKSEDLYKTLNGVYDLYNDKYKENFEYLESERKRLQKFDDQDFILFLKKLDRRFYQKSENSILTQLFSKFAIPPTEENIYKIAFYVPMIIDYLEIETEQLPEFSVSLFNNIFKDIADLSPLNLGGVAGSKKEEGKIAAVRKALDEIRSEVILFRDEEFFGILAARADMFEQIADISNDWVLGEECIAALQEFMLSRRPTQGGFNSSVVSYDEPNVTKSLCVNQSYLALDDESLIHEMNHAILSSSSFNHGILFNKTGLRSQQILIDEKGEAEPITTNFKRYGAIDEVINEYLSQKVVSFLRRDDFKVGISREADVFYRSAFPLLQDFIEENMDIIIKCCMSKKPKDLDLIFGKGNFDELADITTECFEAARGQTSFQIIIKDLVNNLVDGQSIYDIIHIEGISWSKEGERYLNCYRRAEKVFNKIAMYRAENKHFEQQLNEELYGDENEDE